ncbi:hypothetical protein [Cysteiniphilum sp. 6C5]|uniref:hypothetical protein n=1 Tax=unclassified Cysteiniphilum TaxID=2610889 RepID=UPI003F86F5C5
MRRTITGDNKLNYFDPEQISEVLCTETAKKYEAADNVILIHDPSEIRKKYTKQAEPIGKVKDLNKKTINGYSSFNTIAVNLDNKQIDLLSHELYSNKQPEFLSKETIEQLSAGEDIVISQASREAFDEPMLLITNKQLVNQYDVYNVYDCYLKRSRIEGVFKFIKGKLGWEEFRLKNFEGIKAITAIGFFVASYLYEIGQGEVYDDFVVLICLFSYIFYNQLIDGYLNTLLLMLIFAFFGMLASTYTVIIAEISQANFRCRSIGLSYNLSYSIFSAPVPALSILILDSTNLIMLPFWLIALSSIIGIIGTVATLSIWKNIKQHQTLAYNQTT